MAATKAEPAAQAEEGLVKRWRDILAVANVLVPININTGLRDQLTWLVGVEAAF